MEEQIDKLTDAQLLERWRTDLEELSNEITTIFLNQTVFNALHESLVAARGSNIVGDYLDRSYDQAQAVAIRRLVDIDHRARSLRTVLTEMRERCAAVTRDDFIDHAPRSVAVKRSQAADVERLDQQQAAEEFDRLAGTGAAHMPPSVPQKALDDLDRLDGIKRFVDTQIAHADRTPGAQVMPSELGEAVADLETHLNNVTRILSCAEHRPSLLTIIGEWFTPFAGDDRDQPASE
jgi:hypothetical protein